MPEKPKIELVTLGLPANDNHPENDREIPFPKTPEELVEILDKDHRNNQTSFG